eukprot:GHVH01000593.1.p1 GENE.GHVH01000593.1~~GHVH01000593.1.p1  ORF type:complete len:689 (-),score=96.59 GHVH01000593.1:989-3055(-)
MPMRFRTAVLKKFKDLFLSFSENVRRCTLGQEIAIDKLMSGGRRSSLGDIETHTLQELLAQPLTKDNKRLADLANLIRKGLIQNIKSVIEFSNAHRSEYDFRIGIEEEGTHITQTVPIYKLREISFFDITDTANHQPTVSNLTMYSTVDGRNGMTKLLEHIIFGLLEDVNEIYHNIHENGGNIDSFINEITVVEDMEGSTVVTELVENQLLSLLDCVEREYIVPESEESKFSGLKTVSALIASEQFRHLPRLLTQWTKLYPIHLGMKAFEDSPSDIFKANFPFCSFGDANVMTKVPPYYGSGRLTEALRTVNRPAKSPRMIEKQIKAKQLLNQHESSAYFIGNHYHMSRSPIWKKDEDDEESAEEADVVSNKGLKKKKRKQHENARRKQRGTKRYVKTGEFKPPRNMILLGCEKAFKWPMLRQYFDSLSNRDKLDIYDHQYCCMNYLNHLSDSYRTESKSYAINESEMKASSSVLKKTSEEMMKRVIEKAKPSPCCQQLTDTELLKKYTYWRGAPRDDTPSFRKKPNLLDRYMRLQKRMLDLSQCPHHQTVPLRQKGVTFPSNLDIFLPNYTPENVFRLKTPLAHLAVGIHDYQERWEIDLEVKLIDDGIGEEAIVTPRLMKSALIAFDLVDSAKFRRSSDYERWAAFSKVLHKLEDSGESMKIFLGGNADNDFSDRHRHGKRIIRTH